MRRIIFSITLLNLLFSVFSLADPIKIKFSHVVAETTPRAMKPVWRKFAKEIDEEAIKTALEANKTK